MLRDDEEEIQSATGRTRTRTANGAACEKCRVRKGKCSGERPACSRCVRMGIPCVYQDVSSSVRQLADLQRQVHELSSRRDALHASLGLRGNQSFEERQSSLPAREASGISEVAEVASEVPLPHQDYMLSSAPGPSCQTSHDPPAPLTPVGDGVNDSRPSPSISITSTQPASQNQAFNATAIDLQQSSPRYEAISTSYPKPHDRPLPSNDQVLLHLPSDLGVASYLDQFSTHRDPRTTHITARVNVDRTVLPSADHINFLIRHFETHISAAFPIFHIPTLKAWVDSVCIKGDPVESETACAVLLVLAVCATSLPRGSPYEVLRLEAPAIWEYGQKFLPPVFLPPIDERRGLLRVQVMLIRLQYVLYNPNAGNVWGLSGAAVRASVDLGLHHESGLPGSIRSAVESDVRRRVFWIAYSCDRDLGMALGRPPAIQDEWVTAAFPSNQDDYLITDTATQLSSPSPTKLSSIHTFRLRLLQSEIIFVLYASGQKSRPAPNWVETMQMSVERWNQERPPGVGFCSEAWLDLCYHQTVTLLHRPCRGNPTPSRASLVKALKGSSATMRLYKEIYRNGRISFGWLSMYHLFISGVTYLNSLWQGFRNGWKLVPSYVDALLDMQVCTSVMEGLAGALTPGAESIRNSWETVSERMIRQLSVNARWEPLSRQGSPLGEAEPISSTSHASLDLGVSDTLNASNDIGINLFEVENPFDPFLLHPLGEMSNDDWARAVASVFGPQDVTFT